MDVNQHLINSIRKDIIENNIKIKAVIQEINNCNGPLSALDELNSEGRKKIASLRKSIENLDELAGEYDDEELLEEVDSHRKQLTGTLASFRKANMDAMLAIERANKAELFDEGTTDDPGGVGVRKRAVKAGKRDILKMSTNVTEKLVTISRHLADTTQHSAQTLENLLNSSTTVHETNQELTTTKGTISQSEKLLAKYGRREFTDKILMFLAFAFFLACVLYIVQKRLI